MKKLNALTILFCFAAMGLTIVSCSKEEKEDASIVGKWKCIYALVESFDYHSTGSAMAIDTNIYYDESRMGKKWEFTQDGFFFRDGDPKLAYKIKGDSIKFSQPDIPGSNAGALVIEELHEDWARLFNESDTRRNDGQGTYRKNTFVLSKALEQ